jgi:hypothetical protein
LPPLRAEVPSTTRGAEVLLQNQFVTVQYHVRTGRMDVVWREGHKLLDLESGVQLAAGRSLSTSTDSAQAWKSRRMAIKKAPCTRIHMQQPAAGEPASFQHRWMNHQKPWIAIEARVGPGRQRHRDDSSRAMRGGHEATAMAPSMPRGTVSTQPCGLGQIMRWVF